MLPVAVPVLVVAEFEEVLAVRVLPEDLHRAELLLDPVKTAVAGAETVLCHDTVAHLLAPEDVAPRQRGGRQVKLGPRRLLVEDLAELYARDGDALGAWMPRTLVLGDRDLEAVGRYVELVFFASLFGEILIEVAAVRGLQAEKRERRPLLVLAGLRKVQRLWLVVDDRALEGVPVGTPGVERTARVVAVVADMERARLVVGILDHDDVCGVWLEPLALAKSPVEVGRRFRLHVENSAGFAEDLLHAARALRPVREAVIRLGAVDFVDHLYVSKWRQCDCRREQQCYHVHFVYSLSILR